MRIFTFSGLIGFLCSINSLFAQNVNGSIDNIQNLLCKHWEVDYVLLEGMKIGRMPGAPEINFEFKSDKTFLMASSDSKDKLKGSWSYDSPKKQIKLSKIGGPNFPIVSISKEELILLVDGGGAMPNDLRNMQMVYKPKVK